MPPNEGSVSGQRTVAALPRPVTEADFPRELWPPTSGPSSFETIRYGVEWFFRSPPPLKPRYAAAYNRYWTSAGGWR